MGTCSDCTAIRTCPHLRRESPEIGCVSRVSEQPLSSPNLAGDADQRDPGRHLALETLREQIIRMVDSTSSSISARTASKLLAAEQAIDAAMTEAAELMAELLKARKDPQSPSVPDEAAREKLRYALESLSEVSALMEDVQAQLGQITSSLRSKNAKRLGKSAITGQFVLAPVGVKSLSDRSESIFRSKDKMAG